MNSIPPDLSYEIFSRLSTKTIARCRCVSKLWRSILRSADFTELFLTKSSARPSLLFALKRATNEFHFYSSPQIHIQNEKSSLAAYCHNSGYLGGEIGLNRTHELHIWVLEDVVKHDWSEYAYTLPDDKFGYTGRRVSFVSVAGVTATGEIVLYCDFGAIFYFHPERNTIQRVQLQGFENHDRVYAFVNHVDDLTLNIKPHRVQQDLLTFDMNYHQQHVPSLKRLTNLLL
ncbi:putative F-box protein At1g30925 isoform X1 [Brassica napus]|uniref:putative F-box protein At1g30925 isoform X1 n=1 Tax=Brassica napus TaxID=3708 RepID=UPI0006AB0A39|nr:putative F-box protein At1g30925 isoform X1 [Brassica napus]